MFPKESIVKKVSLVFIIAYSSLMTSFAATHPRPDLLSLFPLAAGHDATYLKTMADLKADADEVAINRAVLLPQLSANAQASETVNNNNTSNRDDQHLVTIDLSENIINLNQLKTLGSSTLSAKADNFGMTAATQDLIQRFEENYFSLTQANELLSLTTQETQDDQSLLQLANKLYTAGNNTRIDIEDAKTAYLTSQAAIEDNKNKVDESLSNLQMMLGKKTQTTLPGPQKIPLLTPNPNTLVQWQSAAEHNNPDIAQATYQLMAAKKNIDASTANHLPTVTLSGEWNDSSIQNTSSNTSNKYNQTSGTVALNIPIYSGGSVLAQTKQLRHRYEASAQDRENAEQSTQNDIRQAFKGLQHDITQLKLLKQSIQSAETSLEKTRYAYQGGIKSMSDVLTAEQAVYQQKKQAVNTRYDYIAQIFTLKKAAGQLSTLDLALINQWLNKDD